jgi:hypothetical protein
MAGPSVYQNDPQIGDWSGLLPIGSNGTDYREMPGQSLFTRNDLPGNFGSGGGATGPGGGGGMPLSNPTGMIPPGTDLAGSGFAGGLLSVPAWLRPLIAAATGLGIHAATGGGSGTGLPGNLPPQFSDLLALALQRAQSQQPLFQAATQQAYAGLPTYAKGGR